MNTTILPPPDGTRAAASKRLEDDMRLLEDDVGNLLLAHHKARLDTYHNMVRLLAEWEAKAEAIDAMNDSPLPTRLRQVADEIHDLDEDIRRLDGEEMGLEGCTAPEDVAQLDALFLESNAKITRRDALQGLNRAAAGVTLFDIIDDQF